MNQDRLNILSKFSGELGNLVAEHLLNNGITTEEVDEYYGGNGCVISEVLAEEQALNL